MGAQVSGTKINATRYELQGVVGCINECMHGSQLNTMVVVQLARLVTMLDGMNNLMTS